MFLLSIPGHVTVTFRYLSLVNVLSVLVSSVDYVGGGDATCINVSI